MLFDQKIIANIKKDTKKQNIKYALNNLFNYLKVKDIKIYKNLNYKGSVIYISNHTGIFDSLLLLKTIPRNDLHLIALSTYNIFGNIMKKILLPIYRQTKLNHKIYEYPLCLQLKQRIPQKLTINQIRQKNRATIDKASKLINQGKAVIVFPSGNAGKKLLDSNWKVGIGYLIKKIKNKKTKIVFVNIKGTKQTDIVAYLLPIIRKLLFKPRPISITFSKPYKINTFSKNYNPKTLVLNLEKFYQKVFSWH